MKATEQCTQQALALQRVLRRNWILKPPKPGHQLGTSSQKIGTNAEKPAAVYGKGYLRDASAAALGECRAELR